MDYCGHLEAYDAELHRCNVGNGRMFKTSRTRRDGTCYYTKQPMGIHLLRKVSFKVATFLNLPEPEKYTGHCLRRSSPNTLAEANTSSVAMKQHFNWKSEGTASRYLENTDKSKLEISKSIANSKAVTIDRCTPKVVNICNCDNVIVHF